MEIIDKRSIEGEKVDAEPVEINGSVVGFVPAGDYVLIRRQKSVEQEGSIVRPEAYVELAERGTVVALSAKASHEVPLDALAKFSKYGAEEILFDDEGNERYALVRMTDIRGWHLAIR